MTNGIDRRTILTGASAATIMALLRSTHVAALADGPSRQRGALDSTTKRAYSANQTITSLLAGKLYRVGCVVRAERLSWLPEDIEGFEPLNAYVMTDDRNLVFVEMGSPIMQPAIQTAIDTFADGRKVYVSFSRNEADCIGNMGYILGTCASPTLLYGTAGGILEWINDPHVNILEVRDFLGRIPIESSKNGESKKIGALDFSWFDAGSKMMLMTQWTYEASTGCLFTSDSFGFRHMKAADGPTVVESSKDLPSVNTVATEMVARMNWMRESTFPEVIDRCQAIFKKYDVQMIAPVHGCVIKGRETVAAHVKLWTDAMHAAGRRPDRERLQYV